MLIANDTTVQPENPPKNWGVEVRPAKLMDYKWFILFALISLAFLSLGVMPGLYGLELPQGDRNACGFIGGIVGIVAVLSSLRDPGHRYAEADSIAKRRSLKWQNEILIPFLEAKYGITITSMKFHGWGWSHAVKDNRSFEFKDHGIMFERASFDPSNELIFQYFHNIRLEKVWLEEVDRSDGITFNAVEEE